MKSCEEIQATYNACILKKCSRFQMKGSLVTCKYYDCGCCLDETKQEVKDE